jgi:hypothetical protein
MFVFSLSFNLHQSGAFRCDNFVLRSLMDEKRWSFFFLSFCFSFSFSFSFSFFGHFFVFLSLFGIYYLFFLLIEPFTD